MGRLAGKVALISGGARGQGATEAQLFCREDAKVVFGDVLDDDGRKVEAAMRAAGGEGWCTCSLRLIPQPEKPGKIPSFQHVYEGVLPWSRIFSSTSSR
jgi:NAD(P)-dependent dehydrogenase (short-subunit alcohol dehydrogenase family)